MIFKKNKSRRILIVDDDAAIRDGLKETLEASGFKIDVASDGFEAGIMAIQNDPALIILDLKMQGLDGFSACRLIKTNPHLKDIKILILTGYPSSGNVDKISKLGADRLVTKPIDRNGLLKEINNLLSAKTVKSHEKTK